MIAALWFSTITSHASQHSLIRASEKYNRQRDRIRRQAEKEKTREIRNSHQQLLKETRRLQSRSTLKLGAAMTGIAGLGVILLFTQFMTLGLLAVSATGGALLGYGIRARQYPAIGRPAGPIVGVVRDFHFRSMHEKLMPLYFFIQPAWFSQLSVRLDAGR